MADNFDSSSRTTGRSGAVGHYGTAQPARERAESVVTEFLDAARSAAESLLEEQKRQLAHRVSGMGEALRGAADPLDRSQNGTIARLIEQAAERVETFSRSLHSRRWHELIADTEEFARRQPTLFVLSAVGAGFLLGRLLWAGNNRVDQAAPTSRSSEVAPAVTAAVASGSGTRAGNQVRGDASLSSGGVGAH